MDGRRYAFLLSGYPSRRAYIISGWSPGRYDTYVMRLKLKDSTGSVKGHQRKLGEQKSIGQQVTHESHIITYLR